TNLLGYICFWEVADEIQILNISVHRSYRRRGIGRCLVREALLHGKRRKAKVALLEVRRNNMAARKFYASMGFKAVGERPDYYGPGESAILMELDLVNLPQSTRK
ncbi:MAG: GNAT family N-acetyltransferase, partial [Desulfoferrobacter sp.]